MHHSPLLKGSLLYACSHHLHSYSMLASILRQLINFISKLNCKLQCRSIFSVFWVAQMYPKPCLLVSHLTSRHQSIETNTLMSPCQIQILQNGPSDYCSLLEKVSNHVHVHVIYLTQGSIG